MFSFVVDNTFRIATFFRSFFSSDIPLITKVTVNGQYVTFYVHSGRAKFREDFKSFRKALKKIPGSIFLNVTTAEHMEMHGYNVYDAIATQGAGKIFFNVPSHLHITLPIDKNLFDVLDFIKKYQNRNNVLIIPFAKIAQMKMDYQIYLRDRDNYEKDLALRGTILPMLTGSIKVESAIDVTTSFTTSQINQKIGELIIANRNDKLQEKDLHELAFILDNWKKNKQNLNTIQLPQSKQSLFNAFLKEHPLVFKALVLGPQIAMPILLAKYIFQENPFLAGFLIPPSFKYSSKIAVEIARLAFEKSLPEEPATPYLPLFKSNKSDDSVQVEYSPSQAKKRSFAFSS